MSTVTPEEKKYLVDSSVSAITIAQCEELLFPTTNEEQRKEVHSTVAHVLEIVSDQFYLIPKVVTGDDGTIITRERPEDAITESLAELWDTISD